MRTGVALCHHLWRNAVPCEETLVVADAREDQGFERSAGGTVVCMGDGEENDDGENCYGNAGWDVGHTNESGDGNGYGNDGDGAGNGFGDGEMDKESRWNGNGDGDGAWDDHGDGCGSGDGVWDTQEDWTPGTPYPFLHEAEEAPCEPE